jgi:hypothetical protein
VAVRVMTRLRQLHGAVADRTVLMITPRLISSWL